MILNETWWMVVRCWKFFLEIVTFKKGWHQKLPRLIIGFDKDKIMNILNISVSRDSVTLVRPEYIDSWPIAELYLSLCPAPLLLCLFPFYIMDQKKSSLQFYFQSTAKVHQLHNHLSEAPYYYDDIDSAWFHSLARSQPRGQSQSPFLISACHEKRESLLFFSSPGEREKFWHSSPVPAIVTQSFLLQLIPVLYRVWQ